MKNKMMIIASILLPVIVVLMLVAVIQYIFQYLFCMHGFGSVCTKDGNKWEQPITDKEITDVAKMMEQARKEANDSVDVPGDYYRTLYPGGAQVGSGDYTHACGPYTGPNADIINNAAKKYQLDGQLIAAIAKQESGINHFNPDGSVKRNGSSGATGMMQLMPATARWLGIDPNDINQNVEGGAKYIKMMLNERGGDVKLALAAYNWGPGNLNSALKRAHATTWDEVVAAGKGNKETNNYVANITGFYADFTKSSGECGGKTDDTTTAMLPFITTVYADETTSSSNIDVRYNSNIEGKITAEALNKQLKGSLAGLGDQYIEYGKMYGVDPVFLASLAMQETGNGTSEISKSPYNNIAGITCPSKTKRQKWGLTCKKVFGKRNWAIFPDKETAIEFKADLIKNDYIAEGKTTITAIQQKYAPLSDAEVNKYWVPNIVKFMNQIYADNGMPTVTAPEAGGTSDTGSGDGVSEAELHLRALIETDYYAIGAMQLTKKDLEGIYKDTVLGKTWAVAKTLPKKEKDWTLRDQLMNARTLVYQCYLFNNYEIKYWFDNNTCSQLNNITQLAGLGDYIPESDQGVLRKTRTYITHYYSCKAKPKPEGSEASASSIITPTFSLASATETTKVETTEPSTCNPETQISVAKTKKTESVLYPDLKGVLLGFSKYSLAQPGLTISKKETYEGWIEYYLQEAYKDAGVSGDYQGDIGGSYIDPSSGDFQYPVKDGASLITSGFGPRWGTNHNGMDFGVPIGTPVYSIGDGKVYEVRSGANGSTGYGNAVVIEYKTTDGKTLYGVYGHLLNDQINCPKCVSGAVGKKKTPKDFYDPSKKIAVKAGQTVKKGDLIAYSGNAGSSTGPHLHISICGAPYTNCIDPAPFLSSTAGKKD